MYDLVLILKRSKKTVGQDNKKRIASTYIHLGKRPI